MQGRFLCGEMGLYVPGGHPHSLTWLAEEGRAAAMDGRGGLSLYSARQLYMHCFTDLTAHPEPVMYRRRVSGLHLPGESVGWYPRAYWRSVTCSDEESVTSGKGRSQNIFENQYMTTSTSGTEAIL